MIEKMRFLSLTGPKADFDRVINEYLSRYDIHLENALSELSSSYQLRPFNENNPYKDILLHADELFKKMKTTGDSPVAGSMSIDNACSVINSTYALLSDLSSRRRELKTDRHSATETLHQIEHFRHLDYDVKKIIDLKFIKYRFGKIPHEFFTRFSKYVYENLDTFFYECERDRDYIWGIYFVPADEAVKIDAIFASLHFERVKITGNYLGTPEETYQIILKEIADINAELESISEEVNHRLLNIKDELLLAYQTIQTYSQNFDVRRLAACTKEKSTDEVFYIMCGWISATDSINLLKDIANDSMVYCLIDDGPGEIDVKAPTKLKNIKLFKPFEMFIRMYGVPSYDEIDPTSFVAITYALLFGIMFGDVGQGLVLLIGGALLYKIKKMPIAAIISFAGVFSTVFGFVFGSIFGFEDWIEPLWLSPHKNVMTVLYTAVAFGMFLIIVAMVINIVNSIRAKDWGKVWFDTNGVAGLVFYAALITCVVLIFTGNTLPAIILLIIFFGIPVLLIFFREPLTHLIQKKKKIFPDQKGMFFVESFFELFEIILSYVTNTISFLRVGAFALSHAAMMGVIMLLAGVESGNPNILIIVLGNIFVSALEGLIVGIQVLRLEYYEMFSRFYKGTGKEFKAYKAK